MRGAEIEQAVVENDIGTGDGILYPDGGVTVKLIDGFAGLASEKICIYAVILRLDSGKKEDQC